MLTVRTTTLGCLLLTGVLGVQTWTGRIEGVVADRATGEPLPAVVIRLASDMTANGVATLSDASGRFSFDGLPAGRFDLVASKTGYVEPLWAVGQPAQTLVLSPSQPVANMALWLRRGAAISGTVTDRHARELAGATVTLLTCSGLATCDMGGSRVVRSTTTDDRGHYRFFGLASGEYAVAAQANLRGDNRPIVATLPDDVRAAIERLASGSPAPLPAAGGAARAVTPVVTYFPGASSGEGAGFLMVAEGEERPNVDLATEFGTAATISGVVLDLDGRPTTVPSLSIFPNQKGVQPRVSTVVSLERDGRFVTAGLPPGAYRLATRVEQLFASAELHVNGQDVGNLSLALRPTLSVSGRIALEPAGAENPADLSGIRIELRRADTPVVVSTLDIASALSAEDGQFVVRGLMPGRYSVTCTPAGSGRPGGPWWLKSVVVRGTDVLDSSLEIGPDTGTIQLAISLTSKPSQIVGDIRYPDGGPAAEFMVLAFPVDPALWIAGSRRVLFSRVALDGSFVLKGLPPGEYWLGAVGTRDQASVDRRILESLAVVSHRLTVTDGSVQTVTLSIQRHPLNP